MTVYVETGVVAFPIALLFCGLLSPFPTLASDLNQNYAKPILVNGRVNPRVRGRVRA